MRRICQLHGWTPAQWRAIDEADQLELLGWDLFQQRRIAEWRTTLIENQTVTAESYTALHLAEMGLI